MSSRRRSRTGRILVVALIALVVIDVAQALAAAEAGVLVGMLLLAGTGIACYRAGRRRPLAQATRARRPQAQPTRPPARRRNPLGARIARDTARLLISRR